MQILRTAVRLIYSPDGAMCFAILA